MGIPFRRTPLMNHLGFTCQGVPFGHPTPSWWFALVAWTSPPAQGNMNRGNWDPLGVTWRRRSAPRELPLGREDRDTLVTGMVGKMGGARLIPGAPLNTWPTWPTSGLHTRISSNGVSYLFCSEMYPFLVTLGLRWRKNAGPV